MASGSDSHFEFTPEPQVELPPLPVIGAPLLQQTMGRAVRHRSHRAGVGHSLTHEDVKTAISNPQLLSSMIREVGDESAIRDTFEKVAGELPSEQVATLAENFRKSASPAEMEKALSEMEKAGIDTKELQKNIRKQFSRTRLESKGLGPREEGVTSQGLIITCSRKVKSRQLVSSKLDTLVKEIIRPVSLWEFCCDRIAQGPWKGKEIKIWCSSEGTRNKRASRLAGVPVFGDCLIASLGNDLSEKELLQVESLLV